MATVIGIFTLFEGEENEQVSINWSLTDTNQLTIFNEGTDGVVTLINFEQDVVVSTTSSQWSSDNKNLPGGNNITFNTAQSFKANPSPVKNGIDVGESLIFQFNSTPDVGRVGLHIQSIGDQDASASYVSSVNATVVPEPSVGVMMGVVGLSLILRRRK